VPSSFTLDQHSENSQNLNNLSSMTRIIDSHEKLLSITDSLGSPTNANKKNSFFKKTIEDGMDRYI
jgi:hypothetical protein